MGFCLGDSFFCLFLFDDMSLRFLLGLGVLCLFSFQVGTSQDPVSLSPIELKDGVPSSDNFVKETEWAYFYVLISDGGLSQSWWVNQSSSNEDCDLYVQFDSYPSRESFGEKNITKSQNSHLWSWNPAGFTFAGVFGFTDCLFSISVSLSPSNCGTPVCSGFGSCEGNVPHEYCSCEFGFSGKLCEFFPPVLELISGEVADHQVKETEEKIKYFKIETDANVIQTWSIHNVENNCKLYLRLGKPPTTFEFDESIIFLPGDNFTSHPIQFSESGETYAGVLGNSCQLFSISVELRIPGCGSILSPCSNQGDCVDSHCNCHSGFVGSVCEIPFQEVVPNEGRSYQGSILVGDISHDNVFFFVGSDYWDQVDWIVEERGGKCNLTWSNGEYSWHLPSNDLIINQTKVVPGETYNLNISRSFEEEDCLYSLILNGVSWRGCPNFCSFHGESCSKQDTCECQSGYIGDQCEEFSDNLLLNTKVHGFVGQMGWNYYHLTVDDDSSDRLIFWMKVNSKQSGYDGDCDLLIRANAKPDPFHSDYSLETLEEEEELILPHPEGKKWFIGVSSWSDCEYELSVSCLCPAHSICAAEGSLFHCVCDEGWDGPDCFYPVNTLIAGVPNTDLSLIQYQWKYYVIDVEDLTNFSLVLKKQKVCSVAAAVSFNEVPGFDSANFGRTLSDSDSFLSISFGLSEMDSFSGKLWVGFFSEYDLSFDFVVWVESKN